MTDFQQIYKTQSDLYDRMVSCEDYEGNLLRAVREIVPLAGATVVELGAGTGRITELLLPHVAHITAFDFAGVLLTGLLTQIGKNVVFTDWQRPPKIFALEEVVRIVHPDPPGSRSFPSGHATSIATGGIFFVYFMSEWKRWLPFFIGIFTVGLCFTRVIIGVHFPGDIFVGSMIGSVGGLVLLHYLTPFFRKRLSRFENNASYKVNMAVAFIAAAVILAQYLQLLINT